MTISETEAYIREHGPRVRKEYGSDYYNGWTAAYRNMAQRPVPAPLPEVKAA
jgi:hypothetical protein